MQNQQTIVNDVSGLNPVPVWVVARPENIAEVQEAILKTNAPVSIGGGHFSTGGQAVSPGSLHLDMRAMNRVLVFLPQEKRIRVEAGARWCDVQRFIDPHELAVRIMPGFANFTVGGSLASNAHGRHLGTGPLIESVLAIRMVLPDGSVCDASREHNARIFNAAIGGYGAIGVIVEVELELADNARLMREVKRMPVREYAEWFSHNLRNAQGVVFHQAELDVKQLASVRAISWVETKHPVSNPYRLQAQRCRSRLRAAFSELPGKHLTDSRAGFAKSVHWRNFEAGYDLAMLEPRNKRRCTYALQEYFVPVKRLEEFIGVLAGTLQRHDAEMRHIAIRHVAADASSVMAYARGETFAIQLFFALPTREDARQRVAVWTRELIDAVLSVGGTYYLPYQLNATTEQFHRAYPRARELFALKRELDPQYRFRSLLWDKYYAASLQEQGDGQDDMQGDLLSPSDYDSAFQRVYHNVACRDDFYRFLQNVLHRYPEERLHTLIKNGCQRFEDDSSIYRYVQQFLPQIRPAFASRWIWSDVRRERARVLQHTLSLLERCGGRHNVSGYIEVESDGRYLGALSQKLRFRGEVLLLTDATPGSSLRELIERGGSLPAARCLPLDFHSPIPAEVRDNSIDVVSCYRGLHTIEPADRAAFLASVHRVLRPGGVFIVREYDVDSPVARNFVSLALTVTHLVLGMTWEESFEVPRHFAAADDWAQRLHASGFNDAGVRLVDPADPTRNTLMAFTKRGLSGA